MREMTILLKYGYKSLIPFSPIIQFFRGSQFYWCSQHQLAEKTTDFFRRSLTNYSTWGFIKIYNARAEIEHTVWSSIMSIIHALRWVWNSPFCRWVDLLLLSIKATYGHLYFSDIIWCIEFYFYIGILSFASVLCSWRSCIWHVSFLYHRVLVELALFNL